MNARFIFALCVFGVAICGQVLPCAAGTVVFRDDFDGPAGTPDPSKWVVDHPEAGQPLCDWWTQGRTFFPCPIHHTAGPFPRVEAGQCVIDHHTYNPYHLGTPKTTFLGGEVRTVAQFAPTQAYCFEARVKSGAYPNGLVTSFFVYGYDGARSDEIDFEFLSNKTNQNGTPGGDPVLTNTWDESQQRPQYASAGGIDLAEWNTFRIYWYPNLRVEWAWLDPAGGEIRLRAEASDCLPDEPMSLYFNFWAPAASWPDAFDANLQPAQYAYQDQVVSYAIDYAEVRTIEPLLVWSSAAGQWGAADWYDGWQSRSPQGEERMLVASGRVDVDGWYTGAAAAASLEVETGTVDVGPEGHLEVLGAVTTEAGTGLVVDGDLSAASVSVGGALGGGGRIAAETVTVFGTLSPGGPSATPLAGPAAASGGVAAPVAGSPVAPPLPEPSGLPMLLLGLAGLSAAAWMRPGKAARANR